MNTRIKLILAMTSLAVMMVACGGDVTVSPVTAPDRAKIDRFGRTFFTADCAFNDTRYLKGQEEVFYFETSLIHPGQATYSLLNVNEKIDQALDKNYATKNDDGSFHFNYDNGRALYPKKKAFPVVNTPWGLILLNGHHRTMASVAMGAATIPVKIHADLTDLGIEELRKVMSTNTDPVDVKGNKVRMPCYFDQLVDDPNRYFAKISAYQGKDSDAEKSGRTKYPLWIPVGEESTHGPQEFDIAILLNKHGWVYKNAYGNQIPENFLEYARVLLTVHGNEIPHICVIKNKTLYSDIDDRFCIAK
jgi:hypothetical protein